MRSQKTGSMSALGFTCSFGQMSTPSFTDLLHFERSDYGKRVACSANSTIEAGAYLPARDRIYIM